MKQEESEKKPYYYVKWEEIEKFISSLEYNFIGLYGFNGVYGIPRGGLVLAVMISHYYGIPLLAAPCQRCLVVDDICDSGETLLHYANDTSNSGERKYKIATFAYKEGAIVKPDFYRMEKKNNWIIFPWEMGEVD